VHFLDYKEIDNAFIKMSEEECEKYGEARGSLIKKYGLAYC
jgi:hypothetical protein